MWLMNKWFLQLRKQMPSLSSKAHKHLKEMCKQKNKNPKKKNNKIKDQKMNLIEVLELKVLIFQEGKNKEWPLQDQFWEIQSSYFWTKPPQPWIMKMKRKYKIHLTKLWKEEQQFQSLTELILSKTVTKLTFLTMVE